MYSPLIPMLNKCYIVQKPEAGGENLKLRKCAYITYVVRRRRD